MEVHNNLGGVNFSEIIFHSALIKELERNQINFESEKEVPVIYKGDIIGKKRIDILAENKVLIEIKVISQFKKVHFNQVINYLEIFNLEVGLLIKFGAESLQFKRFANTGTQP